MKFSAGGDVSGQLKHILKLKDGESVTGVFRGDPYEFRQHWMESNNRSLDCIGPGCPECAKPDSRPGFKFRINFIVKDPESPQGISAKIFEQGWKIYQQMKQLHENDYNLEKHFVRLSRSGKGTSTNYSITPVKNGEVSPAQEKAMQSVKLHVLATNPNLQTEDEHHPTAVLEQDGPGEDDLPF